MTEHKFWEYIELVYTSETRHLNVRDQEDLQVLLIKDQLRKDGLKGALDFYRILFEKLRALFRPNLAELFMVTWNSYESLQKENVYISNDGFRDFRSWIIGLGRKDYMRFKNFEQEESILEYDLNPNVAYREDLEYIINELYKEHWSEPYDKKNENLYKTKYLYGCDGDHKEDLINRIDWQNLDKKYKQTFKKYSK